MRKRQKSKKANPNSGIFVVLTNGTFWTFYVIDKDGVVYCSGNPISDVGDILTWLDWFVQGATASSPRVSLLEMTEEQKGKATSTVEEQCVKLWLSRKKGGRSVMPSK